MEYPNQNLQTVMQRAAKQAINENELFGDTLAIAPPQRLLTTNMLQRYTSTVSSIFKKN